MIGGQPGLAERFRSRIVSMHSSIKGMIPERGIGAVFLSTVIGFSISRSAYSALIRHLPFSQNLLVITAVVLAVGSGFLAWIYTRWAARMVLRRVSPSSRHLAFVLSLLCAFLIIYFSPVGLFAETGGGLLKPLLGFAWLADLAADVIPASFLFFAVFVTVLAVKPENSTRFAVISILFAAFFSVGLFIYDDYGVSFDEPRERATGLVNLKYVFLKIQPGYAEEHFQGIEDLWDYGDRYYGAAFQLPLVALEELNSVEGASVWLFHHYCTFLLVSAGTMAFFLLAELIFSDWRYAVIGTLIFILTPRVFAHGFYNTKDAVFLAAYTLAFYLGVRLIKEPTGMNAVLFAAASAFSANVRIIGLFLFALVLSAAFLKRRNSGSEGSWVPLLMCPVGFLVVYYAITPASWSGPLRYLMVATLRFSDFQAWDSEIMYMGEMIRGQEPPWHYLPVWIMITTPLPVLLFSAAGFSGSFLEIVKSRTAAVEENQLILFLTAVLFFAPIAAAVILRSTLYNCWRQFYFLLTPMLVMALRGLKLIVENGYMQGRAVSRVMVSILLLWTGGYYVHLAGWMVREHPHQNVYFNSISSLFGGKAGFERDYWRLSVRQGLEFLLEQNQGEAIHVVAGDGVRENLLILPDDDRDRIVLTDGFTDQTEYYLYTYRFPASYEFDEYHSIVVDGLPILTIFEVR